MVTGDKMKIEARVNKRRNILEKQKRMRKAFYTLMHILENVLTKTAKMTEP